MAQTYNGSSDRHSMTLGAALASQPMTLYFRASCSNTSIENWAAGLHIPADAATGNSVGFRGDTVGDPVQHYRFSNGAGGATNGAAYTINTWHDITAVSRATNDRSIWVDGSETTGSFTANNVNFTLLSIAAYISSSTASSYFNGTIDRVAVWNVALDSADIAQLRAGFSPRRVKPASLALYIPGLRAMQQLISPGETVSASGSPTVATGPRGYGI